MALGGFLGGGAGEILIKVAADVSGATRELGTLNKSIDETATRGQRFRAGIESAAAPAAVALGALAVAGIASAKAAAEDAQARALLDDQIRKSTGANEAAVTAAEAWIDSTMNATAVADDELRPALAQLVRATGDVTEAQNLMNIALDLSAATGASLESTSKALAKAHEGSYTSLKKLVPSLSDAAIKSGSWAKIQQELNAQVGGAAQESAGTAAGQYKLLQIQMGELQEEIGAALLPAFAGLVQIMIPVVELAKEHSQIFVAVAGAVAAFASAILALNAYLKITSILQAAFAKGSLLNAAATKVWAAAQWLLNVAMEANPIGLVALAVVALGVALVIAYRHSQTFRNIVSDAFQAVIKYGWLLVGPIGPFIKALQVAWEHSDTLKRIAVEAFDAIKAAIDRVMDAISNVVGAIGRIHWPSKPSWLPLGAVAGYAGVPAGLAVGPRAAPLDVGGGMTVNVTVTGAVDPEATALQIRRILQRYDRRRGGRPLGGEPI